jgi:ATP-dependent RNA helicase DBP3
MVSTIEAVNFVESPEKTKKAKKKKSSKKSPELTEETSIMNAQEETTSTLSSVKKSKKSKRARDEGEDESVVLSASTEIAEIEAPASKKKKSKKEKRETANVGGGSSINDSAVWSYSASPLLLQASDKTVADYLAKHAVEYIHPNSSSSSSSSNIRPIMDFKFVNFPSVIQSTLDSLKFTAPTPIQAASWPVVLSKKDLVGIAATGSGKTLSFGIPALIHVWNRKQQQVG